MLEALAERPVERMSQIDSPPMFCLNGFGHLVVGWDSQKDEEVRAFIKKMLDQKVHFFILKPMPIISSFSRWAKIRTVDEITGHEVRVRDRDYDKLGVSKNISVRDPDLAKLVESGSVRVVSSNGNNSLATLRISTDVTEIMSHPTAISRPQTGG